MRRSIPSPMTVAAAGRLLAKLRRTAPARLLIDAADADAALWLDCRGIADLAQHPRRDVLVLALIGGAL